MSIFSHSPQRHRENLSRFSVNQDRRIAGLTPAFGFYRQIKLQTAGTLEKRLRALLAEHTSQAKPGIYAERFVIRTGSRIAFVLADEVDWIEAAGDYASLHVGKRTHLLRQTLNSLETRLDPSRFVRIHRSAIVQAARIRDLHTLPNREFRVRLIDGTELKASRSFRDRLDRWLS